MFKNMLRLALVSWVACLGFLYLHLGPANSRRLESWVRGLRHRYSGLRWWIEWRVVDFWRLKAKFSIEFWTQNRRRILLLFGVAATLMMFGGIVYAAYIRISDIVTWEVVVIAPTPTPLALSPVNSVTLDFIRRPTSVEAGRQDFFVYTVSGITPETGSSIVGSVKIDLYPRDHSWALDGSMIDLRLSAAELDLQVVEAGFPYLTVVTPPVTWSVGESYTYDVRYTFGSNAPAGVWIFKVFAVMETN